MLKIFFTIFPLFIVVLADAQSFLADEDEMHSSTATEANPDKNCFAERKVKSRTTIATYPERDDMSDTVMVKAVENYDAKGNIVSGKYYPNMEEPEFYVEKLFDYNKKGQLIKQRYFFPDSPTMEIAYEYDDYGGLSAQITKTDTGKVSENRITGERNKKQQLTKQTMLTDGKPFSHSINIYDTRNRLTETQHFYSRDSLKTPRLVARVSYHTNDSIQYRVKYYRPSSKSPEMVIADSAVFNTHGKPIEKYEQRVSEDWLKKTFITYDNQNREIQKRIVSPVFDQTIQGTTTYDGCLKAKTEVYYNDSVYVPEPKLVEVITYNYQYY